MAAASSDSAAGGNDTDAACTISATAEHSRTAAADQPCDDGRAGK
jgi:hypothetical protein